LLYAPACAVILTVVLFWIPRRLKSFVFNLKQCRFLGKFRGCVFFYTPCTYIHKCTNTMPIGAFMQWPIRKSIYCTNLRLISTQENYPWIGTAGQENFSLSCELWVGTNDFNTKKNFLVRSNPRIVFLSGN
jgi:hypothetical protein